MTGTLCFDIETHESDLLYSMPPEKFVRLIGYKWWGEDEVFLTTDLEEFREIVRSSRGVIGHNIHDFDLRAIFGIDSDEPVMMADQGRVLCTWTHAALVNPAPYKYTNRHGKSALADKPESMKKWFSLDEQAFQLGVTGKTLDLAELAREFGDPELKPKARAIDGFGKIPVDDPRYQEYLIGDVRASEAVAAKLLELGPLDDYAKREQRIAARAAVISSNGLRVDQEAAQDRVDELAVRRDKIMAELVDKYDFPTKGKSPWASNEGKAAIQAALADHGITPDNQPDWTRTETGNPSFGGEVLINITEGTSAEDLGKALAELKGQRSLAALTLECTYPDGKVHPDITMLQRSGRWSTTKPGLTVWTSRGAGAVEKAYYIPDSPDDVLLEIDYSNADARVVAALSGDREYAKRFLPGADGHLINALAAWGEDTVLESDESKKIFRQKAKPLGHGWSYGGQPKTLARHAGILFEEAKTFCDGMNATYHKLVAWQNKVRSFGRRGCVVNHWGRKMYIEDGKAFTQAPALHGQSGTREIVCDALLAMPYHVLRKVKLQIHDAILFSVPRRNWEECRDYLVDLMSTEMNPSQGQRISFPVEAGTAGENWYEASH